MFRFLNKRFAMISAALLVGGASLFAVPARPTAFPYQLPDGSEVTVTLHGDEFSSYYLSSDGYVLLPDKAGYLYYAAPSGSQGLAPTKIKARDGQKLSIPEIRHLETIDKQDVVARAQRANAAAVMKARQRVPDASTQAVELISSYPTIGSPKALILLVEFADQKFATPNPREMFNDMINKKGFDHNGATGSAADYFRDNSSGLFTPDFQVYGPVTVPNAESYYGAQEGQNYDCRAWEMIVDGCKALDKAHPELDWTQFDNDGDGFVDNVFVFYAGRGQNDGGATWTIWPHAANVYTYYNIKLDFDGVRIGNYACTNEIKGSTGSELSGIGTFCHEYSHILGLPDLYATNNSGAFTPGPFEVMDNGSYNNGGNTPPHYSVYDLISVGWLKPRELTTAENVVLNDITTNEGLRISTVKDSEYFLLENRQQKGWDAYIPGHGMIVWHIDYDPEKWGDNTVNNNTSHMNVDIVEADNVPTATTRAGDPFPGTGNVTNFTRNSIPAMKTWCGVDPDMPLTEIRETNGVITFKLLGGGELIDPVEAVEATNITANSFVANWVSRPEIASYEIDICKGREVLPFKMLTAGAGASSVKVGGLEPSTTYRYVVRAIDGDSKTKDSNEISLTTADPTFDMLTAVALPATMLSDDSFTANWQSVDDADSYVLSVYKKDVIDPFVAKADFSASSIVPDGWTTNSNSTGSIAGYFGDDRPALRLTFDGAHVTTPVWNDDVNYVKFWYRAQRTGADSRLDVDGLINGQWTTLTSISPLSNDSGETVAVGTDDAGLKMLPTVKAIRIVFHKTDNSSVYIDDVEVGYGGTYNPIYVDGFDHTNVGNTLSQHVGGLERLTTYYYVVHAVSGELSTFESPEVSVSTLSEPSGVEAIDASMDDVSILRSGDGVDVVNNGAHQRDVVCVVPSGATIYRGSVGAHSTLRLTLPNNGIYILRCGETTMKIVR